MGKILTRFVGRGLALVAVGALVVGCTAGDPEEEGSDDTGASTDSAAPAATFPTGPAPGVTDDSIKVGVTYVDLESLGDVVSISHGDYESAYQALFDDINANGGIHGRTLEPVFAPINPVGTDGADAACLELTEDEDVFVVTGFFLDDNVLCPLETHETAVVGGVQTPERIERANAPWFTMESGSDLQTEIIEAMADAGELDGSLGVYGAQGDQAQMEEIVLPLLDELGVEVTETAVLDAPIDDVAAQTAAVGVIGESFSASGVDKVLAIGTSGLGWAAGNEDSDYRPQLLLTDPNSILAYTSDAAGRDLSIVEGAVAGSVYGGAENLYAMDSMRACKERIEANGGELPDPATMPNDDEDLYVSGYTACRTMVLLEALLEAAGEDLDYGSFTAAADGLEVDLPIQPDPLTYGPPPAADGDPTAYLFDWDPDELDFVLRD
jgi:hypothetical protein